MITDKLRKEINKCIVRISAESIKININIPYQLPPLIIAVNNNKYYLVKLW